MTTTELMLAGSASYAAAAFGYCVLAVVVIARRPKSALAGLLIAAASFATFLWAVATAYDLQRGMSVGPAAEILEIARSACWIILLLSLLEWMPAVQRTSWTILLAGVSLSIVTLTFLGRDIPALANSSLLPLLLIGGRLVLAVIGLGLVENLFRNAPASRRWRIKYLCFGAGALFAYDFFLYADAVLFHRISADLFSARGATNFLAVPLFAVYATRERKAGPEVAVSRAFVFRSATFVGAGIYLLVMAASGYYVRDFGGTWTGFLQAIFFFAAVLLLVLPLSSGSVRAYLRVAIEKSLFKYKYDYRGEWLRFIHTISSTEGGQTLPLRVIQAVGDIADSPEGGLWLLRKSGNYELAASWNLTRWKITSTISTIAVDCSLARFLQRTHWILDLGDVATNPARYEALSELPPWLKTTNNAWLVVPLIHHDHLLGLIVLGRARAPRQLTWEDFDLLKTVGRQAASYLTEQQTGEALAEAQQFEAFNKRFAFVIHDIKNLVSQLSLLLSNAAKHRANAQFQDDMLETVKQSVDKMNRMLKQLHAEPVRHEQQARVDLAPLLQRIVVSRENSGPAISLSLPTDRFSVSADEDRLHAIVEHLVQNAVEAVGTKGRVHVRLSGEGRMAVVEVEDNGPGMDDEFINERLFQPFSSTKDSGYGIGVYESRDFARSLGGGLDVKSRPGYGTIMRLRLPTISSR